MATTSHTIPPEERPVYPSRYRSERRRQAERKPGLAPFENQPVSQTSETTHDVQASQTDPVIPRSMSRYRKLQGPGLAPSVPATNDITAAAPSTSNVIPTRDRMKAKDVTMVVEDQTKPGKIREGENLTNNGPKAAIVINNVVTSAPTRSQGQANPANSNSVTPHEDHSNTLGRSRSRYRNAVPVKQTSTPNMSSGRKSGDPPSSALPAKTKHEHREAIRRVQKHGTLMDQQVVESKVPITRLLTKASLEQIPDANKDDCENRLKQLRALRRSNTADPQNNPNVPKAPRTHASKAQEQVKKMLDAELDRHRRMQEQIRFEKEQEKAAEEAQLKAKQQEEEDKRKRDEEARQVKLNAAGAAKEKEKEERGKKRREKGHQRHESFEERKERYRNISLLELEGGKSLPVESTIAEERPKLSDGKEKFAFLKKRKGHELDGCGAETRTKPKDKATNDQQNIMQGGRGIVPGVDAPVSAVNAGDRRVLVECNRSSIFLPVTPTTTPIDLIKSAATCLNEPIKLDASVLLESFRKVGVQRPLRSYEHIRDVMNSWDDDQQNSLVLVPSPTNGQDIDLDSSSVSAEQPEGMSCHLFYSQRPGKWDKKWITLRPDGQVVCSKEKGHKEMANVCHMSDFDIYTLEQRQLTKKVKPPKKLCFAVKSQQKSNMFMDTENFVHFFCTNEKQVAADWYKAIQGWRSWYLVNIMGEGIRPLPKMAGKDGAPVLPEIKSMQKPRLSSADSHYQLGSFKPLLDFDMLNFGSDTLPGNERSGAMHSRGKSSKVNNAPPSSYSKRLGSESEVLDAQERGMKSSEDEMFAPTGLLGRSYSTRQKGNKDRDVQANEGPFTGGLLGGATAVRPSIDQSRPEAGDLMHSPSTVRRNRPLIDLSPVYQEPAQSPPKGRGYVPEQKGSGGLVESATTSTPIIRSNELGRSKSLRRQQEERHKDENASPFLADGLLSHSPAGWGGGTTGRGVMDGSKVQMGKLGPMLDVCEASTFAAGSLLHKVEADQGPWQPVIDRAKGKEVVIGTGEGV